MERLVSLIDYDDDLFDLALPIKIKMEERLAKAEARLIVSRCSSQNEAVNFGQEAEIIMIQSLRPLLTARVIEQLPNCRGIIRVGLGYDSVDVSAATRLGIPVCNVVDWCTNEVAEHALALIFTCARRILPLNESIRSGSWNRALARPSIRLAGSTLGIIGMGRIGSTLASKAAGLGFRVLGHDPYLSADIVLQRGARPADLLSLLSSSDIISLHLPLTNETSGLIDEKAISKMKSGIILINTSRGAIVDEMALVAALQSGQLLAAALDVFETEPISSNHPLRFLGNVVLTPHVASYSEQSVQDLYIRSAEIAVSLLTSGWATTVVNPGYQKVARSKNSGFNDSNY